MWITYDVIAPVARAAIAPPAPPDLLTFVRERLKIVPDEMQTEILKSTASRGILNCSRQWGKSTLAAAKAVHRAYTEPDSLVIVASPTERQSAELVREASRMVAAVGIRPRGDGDNKTSLLFPNESRIVGLPGVDGKVRGFSGVSLLLIDEASRVSDELYRSLRPMLAASNGDLWVMSTPWGRRGFFYGIWAHGEDRWKRWSVPATACPRISKKFLEEERGSLGPMFGQEYMCEFVDNEASMFDRDQLENAIDVNELPIDFGTWV